MKAQQDKHSTGYILFDEKGIPIGATPNVLNNNTFSKLSPKNCQAIERGYDLDELADEFCKEYDTLPVVRYNTFKAGFETALELMGDKKFSEEDVRKAISYIFEQTFVFGNRVSASDVDRCIQSLQQTEWDVEIEMGHKRLNSDGCEIGFPDMSSPKLDADGCLILKRI